MRYKRILLKLSGSALGGGDSSRPFKQEAIDHVTSEILALRDAGVEVMTVVGGGNIFRGNLAAEWNIVQAEADNMGMLGTVINGVLLRAALSSAKLDVRLTSALPIPSVCEPFIRLRAMSHLERGRVVIIAAGIGQPYVTTDYSATQRAIETGCDAVLAAKDGIDGIYDDDPNSNKNAKRYVTLATKDVIDRNLKAMDQSSLILARDHRMPVHVFNFAQPHGALRLCRGEDVGTLVHPNAASTFVD